MERVFIDPVNSYMVLLVKKLLYLRTEAVMDASECGGRILFSIWGRKRRKLSNQ